MAGSAVSKALSPSALRRPAATRCPRQGLAIEPSLVLLDEPFASLDASLRAALRQDVRRVLKKAGTTALLVTHDQDEALSLADRVAIIHDGQIGQCDTPQALYAARRAPSSPSSRRDELPPRKARATRSRPARLLCLKAAAAPVGTALVVLVRPEQIVLSTTRVRTTAALVSLRRVLRSRRRGPPSRRLGRFGDRRRPHLRRFDRASAGRTCWVSVRATSSLARRGRSTVRSGKWPRVSNGR